MSCNGYSDAGEHVLHKMWLHVQAAFVPVPVFPRPVLSTFRNARLLCIPGIPDFQMCSRVNSMRVLRRPNAQVQGRSLGVAEARSRGGVPCNAQLG